MDRRVKGMGFHKVEFKVFEADFIDCCKNHGLRNATQYKDQDPAKVYENLQLPRRATKGSAGYDLLYPIDLIIMEGDSLTLPTGLSWTSGGEENGFYLSIYPRSSLGIKFSLREPNLVSIIDEDYYGCESNGGHIILHLKNEGNGGSCYISANTAYSQAIVSRYYISEDDNVTNTRKGGIGSTTKR